jgi:hypothetical protein
MSYDFRMGNADDSQNLFELMVHMIWRASPNASRPRAAGPQRTPNTISSWRKRGT